jgi:23S rRNA maturation-related 3'-5' exoribonuclease YhaM
MNVKDESTDDGKKGRNIISFSNILNESSNINLNLIKYYNDKYIFEENNILQNIFFSDGIKIITAD